MKGRGGGERKRGEGERRRRKKDDRGGGVRGADTEGGLGGKSEGGCARGNGEMGIWSCQCLTTMGTDMLFRCIRRITD